MTSIFEALMLSNDSTKKVNLTESLRAGKVSDAEVKKFNVSKFKIESRRVLESENFDELDKQFAVDPESENEGEVVLVIDPEIDAADEVPEDAAENAIGDRVYKCPVCGSNYLCNCDPSLEENVEVDENGVPTECPICGDDAEQILIGEIAPVENAGEEQNDLDPVDPEDASGDDDSTDDEGATEGEDLEEGLFDKKTKAQKYAKKLLKKFTKDQINSNPTDAKVYCVTDLGLSDEDAENVIIAAQNLKESVDLHIDDNVDASVNVTPECSDNQGCAVPEEGDLDFDEVRFESVVNNHLDQTFKSSPKMKVESIKIKGDKLSIDYSMSLGNKTSKGTLHCEGFDINKKVQRIALKDKGVITESIGRESRFEARAVIRNGKLSIF